MEELQNVVLGYASQGRGYISIEISPFQANPSIANVAIEGGSEAILSGDSGFAMYVGLGGPNKLGDVMLRNIKVNHQQSTINCCSLVTGQSKVASMIEELSSDQGLSGVFPTQPKLPLFDNVYYPKICTLIDMGLGCDDLPGGMPGLGASLLQNLLRICNWSDSSGLHLEIAIKLASQKRQ